MKHARILFLLVGIVLFALLIFIFGIREPVRQIIEFGWKFWVCVLIHLGNQFFLTYGWMVLITPQPPLRQYFHILLARIAGDSTTSVSTAAAVAGDPLKAIYLQDIIPVKMGLASVFMDRTIHMVGNTLLILAGIFIGFFKLDLPLWSLILIFAFFTAMLAGLFFIMKKQKSGFLSFIVSKLPRFIQKKIMSPARKNKIRALDNEIRFIFKNRDNLNHFYISLVLHTVPVLIAGTAEIYIMMLYAGGSTTLLDSMLVFLFGLFIASTTFFIPLGIGSSEGSYALAVGFLGYEPSLGVTIGFLRRLRALAGASLGLGLLFHKGLICSGKAAIKKHDRKKSPVSTKKRTVKTTAK